MSSHKHRTEPKKEREVNKTTSRDTAACEEPASGSAEVVQPQSHIMISYNHAYTDIATKIHNHLKHQGFMTWIDYEDMGNDLVDGMIEGVEFAEAVVIIMADEYERSENCRSEAMFARDQKKNIIPIKLSSDYRPRDWLRLLIAGKIYINFGVGDFQENLDSITAAIYKFRKSQRTVPTASQIAAQVKNTAGSSYDQKSNVSVKGADVDKTDDVGDTALIKAVTSGDLQTVQQLLQAGANIDVKGQGGLTALGWAKRKIHTNIAEILQNAGAK